MFTILPVFLFYSHQWIFSFQKLDSTLQNMNQLREFHDPDTVELMEWIK